MKKTSKRILHTTAIFGLIFTIAFSAPDVAQAEQSADPVLSIELNTLSQQETACRMIFLVQNNMGKDLEKTVFETVLFNTDGSVNRLTLFDFQKLPEGRPRVRQFEIPGTRCDAIGRVLINDVHACQGEGISGEDCIKALKLSTKTSVEILG